MNEYDVKKILQIQFNLFGDQPLWPL